MDIQKEIHDFIQSEFASERDSLAPEENLLGQGIIDSMGILKLVSFLESRFKFEAGDDDLVPENFMTLRKIEDFVARKRQANA